MFTCLEFGDREIRLCKDVTQVIAVCIAEQAVHIGDLGERVFAVFSLGTASVTSHFIMF
jgi:hypothetical protein